MAEGLCIGAHLKRCPTRAKTGVPGTKGRAPKRCPDCKAYHRRKIGWTPRVAKGPKIRICPGVQGTPCPTQFELPKQMRRCDECRAANGQAVLQLHAQLRDWHPNHKWNQAPSTKPNQMPDTSTWTCLRCGCTDNHACYPIPCSWVGHRLCSSTRCATPKDFYIYEAAVKLGQIAQLLNGVFKLPPKMSLKAKGREDTEERARYRESARRAQEVARMDSNLEGNPKTRKKKGRAGAHLQPAPVLEFLSSEKGQGLPRIARRFKTSPNRMKPMLKILIREGMAKAISSTGRGGVKVTLYFKTKKVS